MFVGTQQRVILNNTYYYVDMVFYNKILRAYMLIELKAKKPMPEAAGQLNMYLNYYAAEVSGPDDNPPIGIILCTGKDSIAVEYALGGLSNNILASRYTLYMSDKEQLIAQVETVLKNWHEKKSNGHEQKRIDWESTFDSLSSMPAARLCGPRGCVDRGWCSSKVEIRGLAVWVGRLSGTGLYRQSAQALVHHAPDAGVRSKKWIEVLFPLL